MRETLDRMIASLREYFSKMPRGSRIRMAILAAFVVILAIVVVGMLTRTKWVVLPGTSDPNNTGRVQQIQAALGEINVPYRMNGGIVEIPEGRLGEAQAHLRDSGLMSASVFDDYYLDAASGFGVSSEQAKQYHDAWTGDRIATQLKQNPRISNALVIVNSGESSPFRIQTNTRQATASVQITLSDGGTLSQAEAQTIADMVKGAVPGIEYENIFIQDNNLRSYTVGDGSQSLEVELDQRIAYQNRLTQQAKTQAEQLLAPIYGSANLQVQPYVSLNFDRTVINKVEFDPPIPGEEGGLVRSSEEIYERSRSWANAEGIPGTDSNALGTAEYPYGEFGADDYYLRNVIGMNYELNETRTAIEVANGTIEEFGIAVLINSAYLGEGVTAPEYTEEVIDLLANAIGVPKGNITVEHIPFAYIDTTMEDMLIAQEEFIRQQRMDRLIEQIFMYGTIILLAVMIMMLVRTVLRTVKPPPEPEPLLAAGGPGGAGLDIVIDDDGATAEREFVDVDLNQKSAGLEQIERFIDKDAASVTQLLRNWLSDD